MASGLTFFTSSGNISGIGLARAKTRGLLAIDFIHSSLTRPGPERPKKISALTRASESDLTLVFCAYFFFVSGISSPRSS